MRLRWKCGCRRSCGGFAGEGYRISLPHKKCRYGNSGNSWVVLKIQDEVCLQRPTFIEAHMHLEMLIDSTCGRAIAYIGPLYLTTYTSFSVHCLHAS